MSIKIPMYSAFFRDLHGPNEAGIRLAYICVRQCDRKAKTMENDGDNESNSGRLEKSESKGQVFKTAQIMSVAEELSVHFEPLCERLMLCGAARRKEKEVDRLEFVVMPKDLNVFKQACRAMAVPGHCRTTAKVIRWKYEIKKSGGKTEILLIEMHYANEGNWWLRVIERTGSEDNNSLLRRQARRQGYRIDFQCGLMVNLQSGRIVKLECEWQLWDLLEIKYQPPEDR